MGTVSMASTCRSLSWLWEMAAMGWNCWSLLQELTRSHSLGVQLHPPLAHVEDEEAEGAHGDGSNLLPVPRETIPLVLVLSTGWGGGKGKAS